MEGEEQLHQRWGLGRSHSGEFLDSSNSYDRTHLCSSPFAEDVSSSVVSWLCLRVGWGGGSERTVPTLGNTGDTRPRHVTRSGPASLTSGSKSSTVGALLDRASPSASEDRPPISAWEIRVGMCDVTPDRRSTDSQRCAAHLRVLHWTPDTP